MLLVFPLSQLFYGLDFEAFEFLGVDSEFVDESDEVDPRILNSSLAVSTTGASPLGQKASRLLESLLVFALKLGVRLVDKLLNVKVSRQLDL